jgi:hypothetical protein
MPWESTRIVWPSLALDALFTLGLEPDVVVVVLVVLDLPLPHAASSTETAAAAMRSVGRMVLPSKPTIEDLRGRSK